MPALEVLSLSKRYGRVLAVDDVSFEVERGSVFGLLGQNGSGKTSILSCALGLRRPSSGGSRVLGLPASQLHSSQGRVGVVFDAPILVKGLSVRAQMNYSVGLFGHRGGRSVEAALDLVGLAGLQSRRVTQLSLGQQKRLAVAIALAGRPELLVLDEPLSGLDPLGARDLLQCFTTLAGEGLSIVISSHRLNDIEPVLSHAAVLVQGKLCALGSLPELLGPQGVFEVVVDDVEQARRACTRLGDPAIAMGKRDGALLVDVGDRDAMELSRVLVEAGVGLRGLRPKEHSLAALFESFAESQSIAESKSIAERELSC